MKLPLRIHFPGEKRFREVIANVIYSAKSISEVCKWKYARQQKLFQRILRRATVGSHCCFSIFLFIVVIYVFARVLTVLLCTALFAY